MNLSQGVDLAWQVACLEAVVAKREFVDPEQLLAALTKLKQFCDESYVLEAKAFGVDVASMRSELELAADILSNNGVNPDTFRHELRECIGIGTYEHEIGAVVHRSDRSRAVFKQAEQITLKLNGKEIGIGHLFIAILLEQGAWGRRLLAKNGIDIKKVVNETCKRIRMLSKSSLASGLTDAHRASIEAETPLLNRFGDDLVVKAHKGILDPIVGREKEILKVVQTLARCSKNMPMLVGDMGVGKRAIVHGLARRIAHGADSHVLVSKRLIALDIGMFTCKNNWTNEHERWLQDIVKECRIHPEVILFINYFHMMFEAGPPDLVRTLKSALAQGDIRCIATTTPVEYELYVESDPVLARIFEKVIVTEPSEGQTLAILQGIGSRWQKRHRMVISDKVLRTIVDLSVQFYPDLQLPLKAIDLLDEAFGRALVPNLDGDGNVSDSKCDTNGIVENTPVGAVSEDLVARIVSERTCLPLEVIKANLNGIPQTRLLNMEPFLLSRIVGQNSAIKQVCRYLLAANSGMIDRPGPLGVFLFVGPSGVGKTKLARSMAAYLQGSEERLIRFDMSEYADEGSVHRLIGSNLGRCASKNADSLIRKFSTRSYSVVLFEEFHRAHIQVIDALTRIFIEGRLNDTNRPTICIQHTIFILESAFPTTLIPVIPPNGKSLPNKTDSLNAPEPLQGALIKTIDEQVVFHPLNRENIGQIIKQKLYIMREKFVSNYQCSVHWMETVIEWLVSNACNDDGHLKDLDGTIRRHIVLPLVELAASGSTKDYTCIMISVNEQQLRLEPYSGPISTE